MALLRRVRWGNVGRLMALLAAGLLAVGVIRGGSREPGGRRRERAVRRRPGPSGPLSGPLRLGGPAASGLRLSGPSASGLRLSGRSSRGTPSTGRSGRPLNARSRGTPSTGRPGRRLNARSRGTPSAVIVAGENGSR